MGMGATACESVEPGDYVVYRVASTSEKLSDGCYWEYQGADANVRNDKTTLQSSNTFVLYAGTESARYLDIGDVTLDGELVGDVEGGEGYEFEGKTVDVQWDNPEGAGSGAKRTTTTKTEIEMTVDGALVMGEVKIKISYSCNGQGCGEQPPTCTKTIDFVGTEVEDVTLHHDVPAGLGSTPDDVPMDDDDGGPSTGSGQGGEGGEGGEGGAGGEGGGGSCDTCSTAVATGATDNLCTESQYLYEDFMDCACYDCELECGENMCVDPTITDSYCQQCISELCTAQLNACYTDGGS